MLSSLSQVCIFAYGQTGSGKTFSMEGSPEQVRGHVLRLGLAQPSQCMHSRTRKREAMLRLQGKDSDKCTARQGGTAAFAHLLQWCRNSSLAPRPNHSLVAVLSGSRFCRLHAHPDTCYPLSFSFVSPISPLPRWLSLLLASCHFNSFSIACSLGSRVSTREPCRVSSTRLQSARLLTPTM